MKIWQSFAAALFGILFQVFVLSHLPVLGVIVPFAIVVLVVVREKIQLEPALIGLAVGSFVWDIWINDRLGMIILAWTGVAVLYWVLMSRRKKWFERRGLMLAAAMFLAFETITFIGDYGVGFGVWVNHLIVSLAVLLSLLFIVKKSIVFAEKYI